MPGPRPRFVPLLLAGLTLALAIGIFLSIRRRPPLPVLGALPPFSFRATSGAQVSRDALRGRTWVADFIFTRCVGSCPVMTAKMADLQGRAPGGTLLVSFTVDPTYDTTEVLGRYAEKAGARKDWLFVTGAKEALYTLSTDGFKLAALETGEAAPEGPFLHSSRLILVDGDARIRGYYDTETAGCIERLLADMGTLTGR